MNIIGRKHEISILSDVLTSSKSELVAIYGRRRVGKTFLVKEFYKKNLWFSMSGIHKGGTKIQLQQFTKKINEYYEDEDKIKRPKNWFEAFDELKNHLCAIKQKSKKVIFFDELPWLDTPRSNFLSALDDFWNNWCVDQKNIVLVICGSAASWMIKKVLNNKGGLHNRVTQRIRVVPFTLLEVKTFLNAKNIYYSNYEIAQLYMVTGGIPFYLENIIRGNSLVENIDHLCFKKDGILTDEFDNLYKALFNNASIHEQIVQTLASHSFGLKRNELITKAKLKSGGMISEKINELIESGFIVETKSKTNAAKNNIYRLTDEYSLFYLKFILPSKKEDNIYWADICKTQKYISWCGYAYENICLKHVPSIKRAFGISGLTTKVFAWQNKNAQIDMILERADNSTHIIEIKFHNSAFNITKNINENLQNKINAYRNEFGSRQYIMLSIISTFGIVNNIYSNSIIEQKLKLEDLFLI
jgi:uncharacterized protein